MKRTTLIFLLLITGFGGYTQKTLKKERSKIKGKLEPLEIYYENGNVRSKGQLYKNSKVGVWMSFHPNGKVSSVSEYTKKGLRIGLYEYWNDKGVKTTQGSYEYDLKTGVWTSWDSLGVKVSAGEYKEDKKVGVWQYFYSAYGAKKEEGKFKDGDKVGEWVSWYRDGKQNGICDCNESFYVDKTEGAKECKLVQQYDTLGNLLVKEGSGRAIYLFDDGKIKEKGLIEAGRKTGEWEVYNANGSLYATENFKKGRLSSGRSYDSLGKTYNYEQFVEPTYPEAGFSSLYKYVASQIEYPTKARKKGVQGNVHVSFYVDEAGKIVGVSIEKGIGGGCDEEAMRVVRKARKFSWIPATLRGQKVKRKVILPVTFKLG